MPEGICSGVRVVEYCRMAAGPYCAKLLADLGAEVIKVEPPEGDPARRYGPFAADEPGIERSGLFLYCNTNKLGVTLNLRLPTGRRLFHELLKQADVLIEDTPPQAEKPLGLGYSTLSGINSGLVVTSITPFGKAGPHAAWKAYPLNVYQAGGEGYLCPGDPAHQMFPDREPLKAGGFMVAFDAGLYAAIATAGALYERTASGQGQHIDISEQEAQLQINRATIVRWTAEQNLQSRASRGYEFGGVFRAKDGYVLVRPNEDRHYQALAEVIGDPALDDERFKTRPGRLKYGAELNRIMAPWIADHTQKEIYHALGSRGCPTAYFARAEDIVKSPQPAHRGFLVQIAHPESGRFAYPSVPYKMSETPARYERPAPLLGQHNAAILCGRLGISNQALVQLRQAGVV
ncbi:MAG: CoA transferase [Chloroflexi bacterium]|nr:CoA transferase [Chloroflexota bacterium]